MNDRKKRDWKLTVSFGLFMILFFVLIGRFAFIQVTGEVQGVDLQEWAKRQRTNYSELPASRGSIVDRNGMQLAQDLTIYRLYAIVDEDYSPNPQTRINHVNDLEKTAKELAPIIGLEQSKVFSILQSAVEKDLFQVEFGREGSQLTREQKEQIEELGLPGIYFIEEAKRYYPNGIFASQVIGLAQANDDHQITGITGIEAQLDEYLSGEKGSISFQRDKYNTKLMNSNEVIVEAKDGYNVKLTIDQKIQTILEDAMSHVESIYQPERMTATVIDPKTGEILAMSNRPSYNPNDLGDVENWYNDIVSTPIEPGSTVKAFTIAAAIEEGLYNPDETFKSGSYKIDQIERPVTDWSQRWGNITYAEGFQRSSNVAMSKIVWDKLGPERYLDYLRAFHFDQPTGIDLPREQAGTLLYRYPIEQLTTSFGQGSTMTPIQLVKAATALANDGKMMKPYVIKSITDPNTDEVILQKEPEVVGEPISKETADQVLQAMESVITSNVGTGRNIYNLESYTVAGKTGTAQISGGATGYLEGRENYIFSFLGMAPSDDPKLIMYITVQKPKLSEQESGSAPVSYIFKHVMENGLHYLNIQPDKERESTVQKFEMPNWQEVSKDQLLTQLESYGIQPVIIGDGNQIVATNIESGKEVLSTQKLILMTDQPKMPDLTGWSVRTVNEFAQLADLDFEMIGSGFANQQSIPPKESIESDRYLFVEFSKDQ